MTLTGKELTIIDRCVAFYARTKYVFRCLLLLFIYFLFSFTIKSNTVEFALSRMWYCLDFCLHVQGCCDFNHIDVVAFVTKMIHTHHDMVHAVP